MRHVRVIVENDTKKNRKVHYVPVKNNQENKIPKNVDFDQLCNIMEIYENKIIKVSPTYVNHCQNIYKLYVKLEKSTPKLLTNNIKKRIMSCIRLDLSCTTEPYYLYKDLTKIPDEVKTIIDFDTNFFKYHSILQKSLLEDACYDDDSYRHINIKKIILDTATKYPTYISDSFKNHLIFYKINPLAKEGFNDLAEYLDVPHLDINLNKVLELCKDEDRTDLLLCLTAVKNPVYRDTVTKELCQNLKKAYEDNDNTLIHLKSKYGYLDKKYSSSSQLLINFVRYTDCYEMDKIIEITDIDIFINIIKTTQSMEQKKNILYVLFKEHNQILKITSEHTQTKYNKFEHRQLKSLNELIETIKHFYKGTFDIFQLIFSKLEPSMEYMKMVTNFEDGNLMNCIRFRLMLHKGIIPTTELLELICKNLFDQDIYLAMERKVLPTQLCLENYLTYNTHIRYGRTKSNSDLDNINVNTIVTLFLTYGLQFNDKLISICAKNHVYINFAEYGIKYTMEMYDAYIGSV